MWNVTAKWYRNNKGEQNHIEFTQTVPEQHSEIARRQRTTEHSHIGHCTRALESTNTKVLFIQRGN